jgi:hypothetical protein
MARCIRVVSLVWIILGVAGILVACGGSGSGSDSDATVTGDAGDTSDQAPDGGGEQDTGGEQDSGGGETQTLTGELAYESTCATCGPSLVERPAGDRVVFSFRNEARTWLGYTWSEAGGLEQLYEFDDRVALNVSYTADRVLFRTEGDPDTQRIMLFEDGELTDLGQSSPNSSVAVGENVAAWSVPYRTIRVYDLEAGEPVDITNIDDVPSGEVLATANAIIVKTSDTVAVWYRGSSEFTFPSGLEYARDNTLSWEEDVAAWVTTQGAVQRYDAASGALVTFGEDASTNYDPLVDGPRVLWFKDDRDSPYFGGELHVWEDDEDRVLMPLEDGYGCLTMYDGVFWRRGSEGLVRYDPSGSTTTYELSPSVGGWCALSRTHIFWVDDNSDLYVAALP